MKYITKRPEPQALIEFKACENENWRPTYENLDSDTKQIVKSALMEEQGSICCYCERRLVDADSHIEHLRPQSDSSADPLDFSNLLCSCQDQVRKGEPRHCGNLKDSWFDEEMLVSPLDRDCEGHFAYTGDGAIRPEDPNDLAAKTTRDKLGLDIPKLRELRKGAIDGFLDDSLSASDVDKFVAAYLERDDEDRFSPFFTTIRYLFASPGPR